MEADPCATCRHRTLGEVMDPGSRLEPPSFDDDWCARGHDLDRGCDGEDYEPGRNRTAAEATDDARLEEAGL